MTGQRFRLPSAAGRGGRHARRRRGQRRRQDREGPVVTFDDAWRLLPLHRVTVFALDRPPPPGGPREAPDDAKARAPTGSTRAGVGRDRVAHGPHALGRLRGARALNGRKWEETQLGEITKALGSFSGTAGASSPAPFLLPTPRATWRPGPRRARPGCPAALRRSSGCPRRRSRPHRR